MSEREQNKRINNHQRLILQLQEQIKTIELDVQPQGRIANAFELVEEDLEGIKKRLTSLEQTVEHRFNRLDAKFDTLMNYLTKVNDLPEE